MSRASKRQAAAAMDAEIERIYYRLGQGVQISVLDIGRIFAAGRAAIIGDRDLDAAIAEAIATYRKN
jgi:hypothetical protein